MASFVGASSFKAACNPLEAVPLNFSRVRNSLESSSGRCSSAIYFQRSRQTLKISTLASRELKSEIFSFNHNLNNAEQVCRSSHKKLNVVASSADLSAKSPSDTNVVVVGSTGYIGKYVVTELIKRGYNVIAVAREKSGINGKFDKEQTQKELKGAEVRFGDVTDLASIKSVIGDTKVDVVVSCLASRKGGIKDSWLIDYEATKNSMLAGIDAGASHFVLLSAICVQKPLLEFQKAKLKFESELQQDDRITHSIVRPTAFFKSLGGQVESVKSGGPYVMFGDGQLCACKPISESDLASFIADCITDEDKKNKLLPIGGPGEALTPLQQGEMLFKVLNKEPKFIKVPIEIMDFVIGVLSGLSNLFPSLADAAEFGKIGRYYASESMLVLDPKTGLYDAEATPGYGSETLEDFFKYVAEKGMKGQELGDQAFF